ncbi:MAG: hypothetical protein KQH53_15420 [Desulfarculaceae bacterium]|nr:hypothetical protein [Desulfarculaceae bacterium]
MAVNTGSEIVVGVRLETNRTSVERVEAGLLDLTTSFKKQLDNVWKTTEREFSAFVQGTAKDASDTWDKTTKEMNSITGKSLWGSVKAVFQDDMDQVETIWDNAWNSMIVSADKAWDGLLVIVRQRLQRLRRKSKGPEVFPGALAFGGELISASVP